MPRPARKKYLFRTVPGHALLAFVPHPEIRGAYMRVDICVVLVPCPQCKAAKGELCLGVSGHRIATTHVDRRELRLQTQKYKVLIRDAAVAVVVDGELTIETSL